MERREHYIAAVENGRLRLYAETPVPGELAARLVAVPREAHSSNDTIRAPRRSFRAPPGAVQVRTQDGRVTVRGHNGAAREAPTGLRQLAQELDAFLVQRPSASWDFAGSPSLYAALVEELSPANLRRLKRVLTKVPVSEYRIDASAGFVAAE